MQKTIDYLKPTSRLVDAVVDWLWEHLETDAAGAPSLAHLMVVVPTAQSGRSLRLRLAQRAAAVGLGGVLPPQTVLPMQIIEPADETCRTATTVQLQAAFLKFVSQRPCRHVEDGRVVLDEWQTLFRPEYITDFKSHLSFFDQLSDIWRILAGGGLLMSDVGSSEAAREVLAAAVGEDQARWMALGAFETAFFEFLHRRGLRHEVEAIHLAKQAARPVSTEITHVILPALADPVSVIYDVLRQQRADLNVTVLLHAERAEADKFDEWGRPLVSAWTGSRAPVLEGVRDEDVVRAGTDAELAKRIAADFPPVEGGFEVPSLGLCDEELYPELTAAFLNVGYELHNPERHQLSASSLGHLAEALVTVYAEREKGIPWEVLAMLMRLDDVMGTLLRTSLLNGERPHRSEVLKGLDICRNAFLPHRLPKDVAFDGARLKSFERGAFQAFQVVARRLLSMVAEALDSTHSAAGFVRDMLRRIYEGRTLDAHAKEFRSAAERLREALAQVDDKAVGELGLSEGAVTRLLRKTVAEASYSLEPESRTALKTEGWLELAWSTSGKIALAGFNEGAVPDAVVGHAFLPDSLREALGLTTNARRLARDTFLFSDILRARAMQPGSVRAYVSQASNAGDLHRPSRLLFLVAADHLASRAKNLFGDLPPGAPTPARVLVDAWRPRLPEVVEMYGRREAFPNGRLSASVIDTWLKCPFTYLLEYGVGMRRVEEKSELEADDFGTLIHRALEHYALEQLDRTERGLAQLHEEEDIVKALVAIMDRLRATYGANPSVNLRLQLDAAQERLKCFARIQAQWASEGWMVRARPEYEFTVSPFEGEDGCDVPVKGSVDRIDWKEGVGYRLIDYKTWDSRDGAEGRIVKGGGDQVEHARRLKLPMLGADLEERKRRRFLSVQLPLYGRCLEKADPETFRGRIVDYCYVLLGHTPENAVVLGSAFGQGGFAAKKRGGIALADHVELALETARVAIRRIRGNFFWPPGPTEEWKWNLKDILLSSPERDFPVGTPWRDEQERRLAMLQPAEKEES